MKVEQIYTGCLAEAAYYIESNGEAAIIDPLRETQPYIEKLEKEGAKLKYIFETHFHADFVSGHLDLAKKTGATIVYGPTAETAYDIYCAKDGEELKLGAATIKILHTPGHTMESTSFLLINEEGKEEALFSGDTLFLGDVGRPDLAIKQGSITKEDLAGFLFDSLRNKIMPLSDDLTVYPGHGAGSACGKNLSTETVDTLGNQKKTNYALRADMTKEEFIAEVTAGLTPPPQYFPKNAMMNKTGYHSFDEILDKGNIPLSPVEFETLANTEEAIIIDTRSMDDFAAGHIPNSIAININESFAPWVGALITDIKHPILLVGDESRIEEIITRLSRVGYDNTLGYLKGGIDAWVAAGKDVATTPQVTAEELAIKMNSEGPLNILDVRKPTEFLAHSVIGAKNFPLDYINNNMDKLDRKETYYLHCLGGFRSLIAASILEGRGFKNIVNIKEGWRAIEEANVAKTTYTCPSTLTQETIDEAVSAVI